MNESAPIRLNDVNIANVASLAEKITGSPDIAATRWKAAVEWQGGFRSEASVRDFASARSDEPEQLGGTNTGPNPVEQLLAALGNCLAVGYAANATVAGITINALSVEVEGDLDLHAFLGLKPGHAGFSAISARVRLDSDASPDALQALHDKVTGSSPVGHTLNSAIPVDIALV